ncbi:LacI family DNA-binding transcriptional regulator [Belliella kenyensis]|uniref:LacI family DNA-binding transcriptional regulator n=1 Tax=Belliella kenyensis TaxID=1472724 RepID=A0ABV8EGJ8_9BACT|nr:LacI family DNA-binding transcriptional regulator [Belliella kenyensis]MCH7401889.1 LacI family transcriptional regulator [Belliella kenyensis]MDN3604389.1 LacI family DNA-binding transcriptional regulator [Belliella kenyensis]
MKLGQATIKDIAKALNVSTSTVSRALKDYPGISNETKKKVKDLAEHLNYRPNAVALSLRKSKSNTIGVIIPEVVHFFFSTVISGIEEVAFANGYNVVLCQTNERFSRELSSIETMLDNQIDGLLISYSKETEDFNHFKKLLDLNFPIVFFDRVPEIPNTVNVIVNDFQGAYDATKHLIDQGYKYIAHLAGPKNLTISKKRMEGYLAALTDHNLSINNDWIFHCPEGTKEESLDIIKSLYLKGGILPDGIFASNDIAAAGAMVALKELGYQIPSDIGIVGFSNWQFCSMIDPPLSTIAQPGFKMGEIATTLLLSCISNKNNSDAKGETVVLDTELLIRQSSVK